MQKKMTVIQFNTIYYPEQKIKLHSIITQNADIFVEDVGKHTHSSFKSMNCICLIQWDLPKQARQHRHFLLFFFLVIFEPLILRLIKYTSNTNAFVETFILKGINNYP